MNAENIAKSLDGKKAGDAWMARCPSHDDQKPSLSIRDADDGKVLLRCHAGCEQEQVITALRSLGLWEEKGRRRPIRPARHIISDDRSDLDCAERTEAAHAVGEGQWRADHRRLIHVL